MASLFDAIEQTPEDRADWIGDRLRQFRIASESIEPLRQLHTCIVDAGRPLRVAELAKLLNMATETILERLGTLLRIGIVAPVILDRDGGEIVLGYVPSE